MKKSFFSFLAFLAMSMAAYSQDVLTHKSGDDYLVKTLEINEIEIKYKKFDNQNGPTYTFLKSDVVMIRYENGTKDVFNLNEESKTKTKVATTNDDLRMKGKKDAEMNYKGKNAGSGWTAATTILLSPLIGVIPAVACAVTEPSDSNLNYRDPELMKNYDYNKSYTKQAHKIKKRKIWTSFGISSGVWLALVLLF